MKSTEVFVCFWRGGGFDFFFFLRVGRRSSGSNGQRQIEGNMKQASVPPDLTNGSSVTENRL